MLRRNADCRRDVISNLIRREGRLLPPRPPPRPPLSPFLALLLSFFSLLPSFSLLSLLVLLLSFLFSSFLFVSWIFIFSRFFFFCLFFLFSSSPWSSIFFFDPPPLHHPLFSFSFHFHRFTKINPLPEKENGKERKKTEAPTPASGRPPPRHPYSVHSERHLTPL